MSLIAVSVLSLAAAFNASAIVTPDETGTIKVGARIGVLPLGASASADYVLVNSWWKGHFTVGGYFGMSTISAGAYGIKVVDNNISLMPRATYGLNITDQFEVHAGAVTGVYFCNTKTKNGSSVSLSSRNAGFDYGTFVGCDYFFSNSFGVTAELGYFGLMPYANAGVVFKL